jgi:hypothetical protein
MPETTRRFLLTVVAVVVVPILAILSLPLSLLLAAATGLWLMPSDAMTPALLVATDRRLLLVRDTSDPVVLSVDLARVVTLASARRERCRPR